MLHFSFLKLMFVICNTEFIFDVFLMFYQPSQILKTKSKMFTLYHHNQTFRTRKKGHWTSYNKWKKGSFIQSRNIYRRKDFHNQISHGSKIIILNSFDNDHFVGTFDFCPSYPLKPFSQDAFQIPFSFLFSQPKIKKKRKIHFTYTNKMDFMVYCYQT